jgi:hypothetical protein
MVKTYMWRGGTGGCWSDRQMGAHIMKRGQATRTANNSNTICANHYLIVVQPSL